jgi:putative hydrolase of the HAD superfamily
MSGLRAVLFDFFGTLTTAVERGAAHANIARQLGCSPAAFNVELDRSFAIRARGGYGSPIEALRRVARDAGGTPSEDQLAAALAARVAAVRADTLLRPETVPVLAALRRRGLLTGVVSDCCHELPLFLPAMPIAPLLSTCVYSIDLATCKPDPRMYLVACERLGVRPQQCLYVGDGGSRELSGAAAVGMTPVRLVAEDLAWHLRFDADDDWAGREIPALSESLALVAGLPARPRRGGFIPLRWTGAGRRSDRAAAETSRRRRTGNRRRPDQRTAR